MSAAGWYVWYAVRRGKGDQPSVLVGAGGYLGSPNKKGEVEIGFSVMPSAWNNGYATEMAKAFVLNAFGDIRVQKIIAYTKPDNITSIKVLMKSGFRYVSRDQEPGSDLFQILKS